MSEQDGYEFDSMDTEETGMHSDPALAIYGRPPYPQFSSITGMALTEEGGKFRTEDKLVDKDFYNMFLTTDINIAACDATAVTSRKNTVRLQPIRTRFGDPLMQRLRRSVDVVLFNPPYVLTPPEEVNSTGIEAAWAGGIDGRQVIDEALPRIAVSFAFANQIHVFAALAVG
ncbi:HemK methyltransferase member 2 [Phlyctochytrium bullatum]|nr:HemK methyltransferase member 2 [Phlyctochytrium bullatum]